MQDKQDIKPQLHQSYLALLYRCGEKFRRIVLEGEREPSTIPLIVGSATHTTIAKNLNNKIDKGSLFAKEVVQDCSRDDFVREWQESSVVLSNDEAMQGLNKTKDFAQDQTIRLVTAHHYDIANLINPKIVERKWVLNAKDYPYDMAGQIDIDEGNQIRDTKTMKVNGGQRVVDFSEQYSFYAMAKYLIDGTMPDFVIQDNLVKPTKTRDAYGVSYKSTRTKDDFRIVLSRFSLACKIIEQGSFVPANPVDPLCSPKFCGFYSTCPYVNGKRVIPLAITKKVIKQTSEQTDNIIQSLEKSLVGEKNAV